jgi:hypothetical protein
MAGLGFEASVAAALSGFTCRFFVGRRFSVVLVNLSLGMLITP